MDKAVGGHLGGIAGGKAVREYRAACTVSGFHDTRLFGQRIVRHPHGYPPPPFAAYERQPMRKYDREWTGSRKF
jgi:hypothetical protein